MKTRVYMKVNRKGTVKAWNNRASVVAEANEVIFAIDLTIPDTYFASHFPTVTIDLSKTDEAAFAPSIDVQLEGLDADQLKILERSLKARVLSAAKDRRK